MKIVVCLMVKNEAKVIERCLASLRGKVSDIVVVDTGSTDDTINKGGDLARVYSIPWEGFAKSRSYAMRIAREVSAYCDYMLVMDADQVLEGTFPEVLTADSYMVKIKYASGGLEWRNLLLTKTSKPFYCKGTAHEYVDCDEPHTKENLDGVTLVDYADGGNRPAGTQPRWEKDLPTLDRAIDTRNVFYLAQNYRDLHLSLPFDPKTQYWKDQAISLYKARAALETGYVEERYYSLYWVGKLTGKLPILMQAMQEATRPRWEAAHELCKLLNEKRAYHTSYAISSYVMRSKPDRDVLFFHTDIHDYLMDFEHAISAYWVGQYAESFAINSKLASMPLPEPYRGAVAKNLEFARSKLNA